MDAADDLPLFPFFLAFYLRPDLLFGSVVPAATATNTA